MVQQYQYLTRALGMENCTDGLICTYNHQRPYNTMISIPHDMGGKGCGNYSYLWG